MAAKVRLSFLTVFLTLLSIAFTVALAFRIRSYRAMEAAPPATTTDIAARTSGPSLSAPASPAPVADATTFVAATPVGAAVSRPSAGALTREQRYRELLAMGNTPASAAVKSAAEAQPRAKPTPPPQKPQSALARLLHPMVNAVTGGPKPPAQPPAVQHTTTMRPEDAPKRHEDLTDPNSDTTPPQLISIEFNPPQVHDGEETLLIITATDDLSGIRGISGTLTSPTGKALQGFAQQREGETNRYVSRLTIPKDAQEGTWRISFLNMSDLATNMITLNYADRTIPQNAVLRVISSRSDSSPPTLRAVSIARRAMRTGEMNTLYVEVEDDKSGVRLVSAVFVSPSKTARLGYGCKKGEGDIWECTVNPPECLDCGEWQLEQLQMQDNANNYTTVRLDNPLVAAVHLNIAGNTCDSTPPVIQSVTLDKGIIVIGQGEAVMTVKVVVTDDLCGIGGLSGQISGPGTNAGTFFAFAPEGGEGGSVWVGTFRLNAHSPRGIWRLQSITVNDRGQNLRIYYANDPVLGRGQFIVK